ncbi:MAG: ABC transporter permease [Cyclobacteriaceae bacterium]
MRRFKAFVIKEFYHILRDTRTLVILFGMPIAQILLFGFAITNEIKDAKIAVYDQSMDEHTALIKDKLLASGYFILSSNIQSEQMLETVFRDGQTKMAIVFPQQFGKTLEKEGRVQLQLLADATDPNTANTLVNYVQAIVGAYNMELNHTESLGGVNVEARMIYNESLKGVYYFVPGLIVVILMLVSAMMTSISITREKELGTMEVLLASPMQPIQIILAKVLPYVFLALLDGIVILAMGKFIFGVPIVGSIGLLMMVMIIFIVLSLSLGILISTVAKTQQVALLLSLMALMLPTILLSGFIFPIENMPIPLQIISNIIPARWFIVAVKAIMLKGSGILIVWKEVLIMCGFIVFFLAVSIKKFKVRLE